MAQDHHHVTVVSNIKWKHTETTDQVLLIYLAFDTLVLLNQMQSPWPYFYTCALILSYMAIWVAQLLSNVFSLTGSILKFPKQKPERRVANSAKSTRPLLSSSLLQTCQGISSSPHHIMSFKACLISVKDKTQWYTRSQGNGFDVYKIQSTVPTDVTSNLKAEMFRLNVHEKWKKKVFGINHIPSNGSQDVVKTVTMYRSTGRLQYIGTMGTILL